MYKRIVSLAPSNTEILYALGAQDRLAAVTRYCDFPEEASKQPRIGGWLDINDELVKSYNPDLVLTSTFVQNKITSRYKKSKTSREFTSKSGTSRLLFRETGFRI